MKIIKRPFVKLSRMALLLLLCLIPIGFPYNVKANGNSLISDAQYIPGEIVLIFKPEVTEDEKEELITSIAPDATVIDSLDSMSVISVKSLNKYDWYLKHFNLSPLVTSAEPNYIISSMNLTNDTYITSQWAVKNTGSYRSFINSKGSKRSSIAGIDLNLENTWDYYNLHNLAKEKVIVAIIDTGVDIRHKDLSKHIWKNTNEIPFDGIDNDDNGYIDDVNGWDFYNNDHTLYSSIFEKDSLSYSYDPNDNDDHGTHVAGIIGAVANNNIGIAGVASNINI